MSRALTVKQLDAAEARSKRELDAAEARARKEREHNREQAALERQHAADEARRDRLAQARREIYLQAADEVTKAQLFLAELAKQDLRNLDYSAGMQGFLAAVTKISLIGETPTVLKIRDLNRLVNRQFMKSLGQLAPLGGLSAELEVHVAERTSAQNEIDRLLAAMTHFNETKNPDAEGFAALQRSFQGQQARQGRALQLELAARNAYLAVQRQHGMVMKEFSKEAMQLLDEIAFAVRAELELETDEAAFRAQTVQMQEEVQQAVDELNAAMDARLKAELSGKTQPDA